MTQAKEYGDHFIKTFRPDQVYPSLISDMLLSSGLNQNGVSRIAVDSMIAAADTTAASIQWALYLLARNPLTQEAILKQVEFLLSQPNESTGRFRISKDSFDSLSGFILLRHSYHDCSIRI